jgi:hypothetical protein
VVGLDIHEALGSRENLRSALVRMLEPHADFILRASGLRLRRDQYWKLLHGTIPLGQLTQEAVYKAMWCLPDIAAAVDESLHISGATPIWRTGFEQNLEDIGICWFGSEGGQSFVSGKGRFASTAMKVDGTKANGRNEHGEKGNFSVLLHPTHGIQNAGQVYVCAVVKACKGGTIRFWADAHRGKTSEGYDLVPFGAFSLMERVKSLDGWQCIYLTAKVPTTNDLNYDFAKEGAWLVMNVITEDTEFLIDSIEVGQCSPGS